CLSEPGKRESQERLSRTCERPPNTTGKTTGAALPREEHVRALPLLPRWLLLSLAVVFGAATILYAGIWMYCVRWSPRAKLGIEFDPLPRRARYSRNPRY